MDGGEDDHAEGEGGGGIPEEKEQVGGARQQSGQRRGNGRAEIDCPIDVSIRADAMLRRDEVRNGGIYGGTVEVGQKSKHKGGGCDRPQVARKPETHHRDRRGEKTDEHHWAASEAVGQFAAGQLGQERPRAEK